MNRSVRAIVYGDVDLNLIDGSAIWLGSMCEALSGAGVAVRLVLKAPVTTGRLVDPLRRLSGVTVIDPVTAGDAPSGGPLSCDAAVKIVEHLDATDRADIIVVRGRRVAGSAAGSGRLHGRLWTYLTDIPQNPLDLDDEERDHLAAIGSASRWMLCQTEELRSFLEACVPGVGGRCVLWNPVVPAVDACVAPVTRGAGQPLRLVYSGKFAPRWKTLEMTHLPARLAEADVSAELHMVGDKIHDVDDDPTWSTRMRAALESSPGVVWHGGLPRDEAMAIAASGHVGLSWRAPEMNASLELSTKVLEFASLGVPVLLNRTPMHEALFGGDYPLFVDDESDIVAACGAIADDPQILTTLSPILREASSPHRIDSAVERLDSLLERSFPREPAVLGTTGRALGRPLRVVVASHDLKFFTGIQQHLDGLAPIDLRLDYWKELSINDPEVSKDMAAWADVVICEWAGHNVVWYSRHKRAGQRLIVRLHRFEIDTDWLGDVRSEAVDQIVCVSPHYARLTAERTGWPVERIVVIPNYVDVEQFERPKLPGAEFTLGVIGISPHRKRPDLALEVLSRLRRYDWRYRLAVKSKMPWEYPWIWDKASERAAAESFFSQLHDDPIFAGAVVFDGFGGDVAAWLRRVGWILSTSDDESFHLAPAEGMASAAVPAIRAWPGSDEIYDTRWIHSDPADIARSIHEIATSGRWDTERRLAQEQIRESFPLAAVGDAWARILVEDRSPDSSLGTHEFR